jgi:hypothetical protein
MRFARRVFGMTESHALTQSRPGYESGVSGAGFFTIRAAILRALVPRAM